MKKLYAIVTKLKEEPKTVKDFESLLANHLSEWKMEIKNKTLQYVFVEYSDNMNLALEQFKSRHSKDLIKFEIKSIHEIEMGKCCIYLIEEEKIIDVDLFGYSIDHNLSTSDKLRIFLYKYPLISYASIEVLEIDQRYLSVNEYTLAIMLDFRNRKPVWIHMGEIWMNYLLENEGINNKKVIWDTKGCCKILQKEEKRLYTVNMNFLYNNSICRQNDIVYAKDENEVKKNLKKYSVPYDIIGIFPVETECMEIVECERKIPDNYFKGINNNIHCNIFCDYNIKKKMRECKYKIDTIDGGFSIKALTSEYGEIKFNDIHLSTYYENEKYKLIAYYDIYSRLPIPMYFWNSSSSYYYNLNGGENNEI